ncbi:MAG: MBL fold metallo-hydrolase [Oscillospiraceae bacterium]|nr:MBL fold metallo-hydrolase [Oscillospiraceae bacterium]
MAKSFRKLKRKAQKALKAVQNIGAGALLAAVFICIFWPAMGTGVDLPFGGPEEWLDRALDVTGLAPASGVQLPESGPFVCALDVGQGDAVLVGDSGHFALIDTGTPAAAEEMIAALDDLGVDRLEVLVLTHPHEDHIGGASRLLEEIPVEWMVLPDVDLCPELSSYTYEKLLVQANMQEIPGAVPSTGDSFALGGSTLSVVGTGLAGAKDYNQISLAVRFDGPGLSFLATGDAEEALELALVASGVSLRADVFKAGHHGSDTSNSAALLAAVLPKVVLVSCGADNDYGHPHQGPLARFGMVGAQVLRTDEQGILLVTPREDGAGLTTAVSRESEAA